MVAARTVVALALLVALARGYDPRWCATHPALVCDFQPTAGHGARGRAVFRPAMVGRLCRVHILANFTGLTPSTRQGWHIHRYGDMAAADGTATGGHFTSPRDRPWYSRHGLPTSRRRHWGDLGNLRVDARGRAAVDMHDALVRIDGIIGRGMIVHALVDQGPDAQPTGASGARVAQCVIGIANPTKI